MAEKFARRTKAAPFTLHSVPARTWHLVYYLALELVVLLDMMNVLRYSDEFG